MVTVGLFILLGLIIICATVIITTALVVTGSKSAENDNRYVFDSPDFKSPFEGFLSDQDDKNANR
jgi:hypothetical protein